MIEHWEIGKLDLKPGQIVIVRYTPTPEEGAHGRFVSDVLKNAKEAFSGALEEVGLKDRVPLIVITDQFDINVICPLEFMDICVRAKDEEDRSKGNS